MAAHARFLGSLRLEVQSGGAPRSQKSSSLDANHFPILYPWPIDLSSFGSPAADQCAKPLAGIWPIQSRSSFAPAESTRLVLVGGICPRPRVLMR